MISRKIDLTEHHDFGNTVFDFSILNIDTINRALKMNRMEAMSLDDYQLIERYEAIFGIKLHSCQAYDIFSKTNDAFTYEMESHCQRCGALLLPWKSFHGLCGQCRSVVDAGFYGRIPWKRDIHKLSHREPIEDPREIFSLK